MGYATKLDTNGSRPDVLAGLLQEGLLDCVAMDVKAPLSRYAGYVQVPMDTQAISLSLDIVKGSGLDHELRTTVVKGDLDQADFQAMAQLVSGAKRYVLQRFQTGSALVDPTYGDRKAPDPAELQALAPLFHGYVTYFEVR
jgi:pyruvate formate lyase activating enzyme